MRYQEICEAIEDGRVFALSRWGMVNGIASEAALERTAMGSSMVPTVPRPASGSQNHKGEAISSGSPDRNQESVRWAKMEAGHQNWDDADALHKQSPVDELRRLLVALSGVHVVFIGNAIHRDLPFIDEFIEVGKNTAWDERAKGSEGRCSGVSTRPIRRSGFCFWDGPECFH